MKVFNETGKFDSIEGLKYGFNMGGEYDISYNGYEYHLYCYPKGKKESFAVQIPKEDYLEYTYNSFDEMLDGYMAQDGKTLREFILLADVDSSVMSEW